jgi:kynurenine formamidase
MPMCVEGTLNAHPHTDASSAEPADRDDALERTPLPGRGARSGGRIGRRTFLRRAAPIVVVDISARAAVDPDAEVTVADVRAFERRHGRIPHGALVAMYSGWETRIGDQAAYRNADAAGVFHFPGFGVDAAEWLLENRDIQGIGVDTLSQDNGPSATFPVHFAILGAERYGIENLANLSLIPPRGATAFVGLVPWERGSGGPARVIANW